MSWQTTFCAARSGESNHFSRSASISGSTGQPNQPPWPLPRSGKWPPGLDTESPPQVVQKLFQPPFDDGSWLARRPTSVPQSMLVSCEFRPTDLKIASVTAHIAFNCSWSDGDIST